MMRFRDNDQEVTKKPINSFDGIAPRQPARKHLPSMSEPYTQTQTVAPAFTQGSADNRRKTEKRFKPGSNIKSMLRGARLKRVSKELHKLDNWYGLPFRVATLSLALILFSTFLLEVAQPKFDTNKYEVKNYEGSILKKSNSLYADKLKLDAKSSKLIFNEGYKPGGEVAGQTSTPKFTASFDTSKERARTVSDPQNEVAVTFKPKYKTLDAQKYMNKVVYPVVGKDAKVVYTLNGSSVKEDIVLNRFQGDTMDFSYDLSLNDGLEARLEKNGSIGVYGVQSALLGNVATGNDKDADILKKARQNGKKDKLIFQIPAPFIYEGKTKQTTAKAWYSLDGSKLTIHASGLSSAHYPLSIDPSVYVETAAKLMRGNNETNTDFDIDDELIQKSQTTGARIDAWQDNLDIPQGTWGHSVAAAGGYIYQSGGRTGPTKPQVMDTQETRDNSDGTTFTMNMPTTRPAGDLYVAMFCHDGSNGSNVTAPSGWTEFADLQGYAAYYKVGTDQGGGNEAASYQWSGPNERYAGVIVRVTGFDSANPVSGSAATTSSASNATPTFPAVTPSHDATLILRGTGFDQDAPSLTGWVPSGHTKLGSNNTNGTTSGGNNTCGYAAASLNTSPLSGVSAASAAFADASVNDDYGASSIAIRPAVTSSSTQDKVYWAKFNSTSLAIESPNPGNGACSSWCNNSAYNLPAARRGHSMVAYNGYLYVIGGLDGSGTRTSTVYIAKLGSNGEPQLWHPSGGTPAYWYTDTGLSGATAKSYMGAVAYNNRMYIIGGQTNATPGGVTNVDYADIKPNGTLGTWSAGSALPAGAGTHMQTVHIYNDVLYNIGGFEGASTSSANMRSSVYYAKISQINGSLNTWTATTSFTTARASFGGSFTAVWGAYVYLGGGCTAVNASGYCTTVASDTQIGSLNADGTISEWGSINNLQNDRIGYNMIGWQNGLYRLGGCSQVNTSTGECANTLADVDYGVVNPAGEVSTVDVTVPSGSAPCSGGSPYSCDLPPVGDDAGEGGQMLSMSVVINGYLYVIGGCIALTCNGADAGSGDDQDVTGNISYVAVNSNGRLSKPTTCGGTSYGAWCVDSTNKINDTGSNTTDGVAAGGVTVFNGRIYVVGGLTGNNISTNIYYNSVNTDGSLAGAWSSVDMTTAGISTDVAYTYAYARANPASAGSNPGNLYVFGGCGTNTGGAGCGSSDYRTEVYKCNINTSGAVVSSSCSTSGQLQIDSTPGVGAADGLGIHSGTVYANYIFLIGGYSQAEADKDDVLYAKFDNSNNVVAASGSTWIESPNKLSVGRRRGFSFGYNGHVYSVGGYDAGGSGVGGVIPFIEWSKMNVSDGSIDPFVTSSVQITQRWGLSMIVSNSYAYVIGGCDDGTSPGGCNTFENSVQTFQLYNNDSGAAKDFTAQSDQTFSTDTDRWGASSAVYTDPTNNNTYLYVAGGCTSPTDCTTASTNVQKAQISASDGTVGSWSDTSISALPQARAWGELVKVGSSLYYMGGQDSGGTIQSTVYYANPDSSGNIASWTQAAGGIGDTNAQAAQARTRFGAAVWNDRIYVVGGLNGSSTTTSTVYISPQLSSGGTIAADSWASSTAFNVARTGAAVTAYANNLYIFGGYDGTNYLSDVQFSKISTSDGTVGSWSYTTNMPNVLRDARAISVNGYIYLVGGRTAATTCTPKVMITPISANTTIASGNNPTGIGEWYETNVKYTGDRYGAAVAYDKGKLYTMGGGCSSPLSSNRHYYSTVKSQPQVAIYSRMIDTDIDVFPTKWLMNGLDNSIGARWQLKYRSMHDLDTAVNPNEDCGTSATMAQMTTWGQETNVGDVTLGTPGTYTPKESGGGNINCARYYYFYVSIDASKTFGYPEDVNRGPTISDLSLFFTADPSRRMRHGKTFNDGNQQPFDTPF